MRLGLGLGHTTTGALLSPLAQRSLNSLDHLENRILLFIHACCVVVNQELFLVFEPAKSLKPQVDKGAGGVW